MNTLELLRNLPKNEKENKKEEATKINETIRGNNNKAAFKNMKSGEMKFDFENAGKLKETRQKAQVRNAEQRSTEENGYAKIQKVLAKNLGKKASAEIVQKMRDNGCKAVAETIASKKIKNIEDFQKITKTFKDKDKELLNKSFENAANSKNLKKDEQIMVSMFSQYVLPEEEKAKDIAKTKDAQKKKVIDLIMEKSGRKIEAAPAKKQEDKKKKKTKAKNQERTPEEKRMLQEFLKSQGRSF